MNQIATFGAGCFWGAEDVFQKQEGVIDVVSGYMGGHVENPTYEQVCSGSTGHAEVVQITYDPEKISYRQLLDLFWRMHDPTQYHRQGPDVGEQYRSVIFVRSPEERTEAEALKEKVQTMFDKPVVTEIVEAGTFWPAEAYHQNYVEKTGRGVCHVQNKSFF